MADNPGVSPIARLVVDHHAEVYRYAYRLTGTTADAEDLTQQTFLNAQMKLSQLRSSDAARAWLFAILRNCYLKSRRRRVPALASNIEMNVYEIPADAPLEPPFDRERLQAALDQMPDEFKIVVLMFYFEECSYREIAERLDIPLGTVMSRLSRAKGQLRGRLFELEVASVGEQRQASSPPGKLNY